MIDLQYGTFSIQSPIMLNVLEALKANADKNFFIIVGDVGTGKSTMLNFINKLIFNNNQANLFDELNLPPQELMSAIVATSKEMASHVINKFNKQHTHIIEMPSLYERKADIINFSQFFIEVLSLMNNQKTCKLTAKLTEKSLEKLLQYNWPGNFHELESVLERAFENSQITDFKNDYIVNSRTLIEPEHIELNLQTKELEFSIGQKLDEVERKYILQTLYFAHQNRTRAAEILGISIRTLRNKINQYREEGYL